jgi:prolyl-tRNA synthetase
MKDAYSFARNAEEARSEYNKMFVSYLLTFQRLGLTAIPMEADTGPIGGDLSHEFIILAETGESEVFCHKDWIGRKIDAGDVDYDKNLQSIVDQYTNLYAATDEKHDPAGCGVAEQDLITTRGIEVGHIFYFGTKYSAPMGASVADETGGQSDVHMGSYGIGVSRLVGGIIEASHDEAGIIWPESVAPFDVAVVNLKPGDTACDAMASSLYDQLTKAGKDVLYDDTQERPGAKLASMDLIGIPQQVIIGPRIAAEGKVEWKQRRSGETQQLTPEAALNALLS